MGYSGARGTLIYEKNLMSKISCQTPLTVLLLFLDKNLLGVFLLLPVSLLLHAILLVTAWMMELN